MNTSPIVVNELRVIGSRCGDLDRALTALANEGIDLRPLIAARLPLARADEALTLAAQPEMLKVLVDGVS